MSRSKAAWDNRSILLGTLLSLTVGGLSLWIFNRSFASYRGRRRSKSTINDGVDRDDDHVNRITYSSPDLPSHMKREIHKEKRRKENIRFLSLKRPMYDNIAMYGPDGITMLCTIGQKKAHWYVNKNLAVWRSADSTSRVDHTNIDDDGNKGKSPRAIQLLFTPANSHQPPTSVVYNTSHKRNICVACGSSTGGLMRHYVVPYSYRRLLPARYKTHMPHDVVLLCLDCQIWAGQAIREQREVVYEQTFRTDPDTGRAVLPNRRLKHIRSCAQALLKHADSLPPDRRIEYERVIVEHLREEIPQLPSLYPPSTSPLTSGPTRHDNPCLDGVNNDATVHDVTSSSLDSKNVVVITASTLEKLSQMDTDFPNPMYIPLPDLVVATLQSDEDIVRFVRDWRRLFIRTLSPRFLPNGWSVDSPVKNDGNRNEDDGDIAQRDEIDVILPSDDDDDDGDDDGADSDEDSGIHSSGCCELHGNSSHSTLGSDDGMESAVNDVETENDETTVHCEELQPDIQLFWTMVTDSTKEDGTSLFQEIVSFCEKERNRNLTKREGETPSAALAMNEATELRQRFTNDVMRTSWDRKAEESWHNLSDDNQDEFLSRLFLPRQVGGLL